MSRLIFAAAVVLSALTATPMVFAKEHRHAHKAPRYINIVRPSQGYAIPRWSYAAPRPPVQYDSTPSYNDPSKFGGSTALPVTR
ncbi:hypothetical protein [Bradyrhizobium sp. Tv2a-2]|uniref:hypothetical protein n=1 Tax=Bradyrhizobium sp. Tv2a-2 TaxID=113395 RepID=UPI000417C535|nr:hypothetical protein [Bradyrhizobium sp. Tv2a-2]